MKTILLFDQLGQEEIKFLVVEGDYSHLQGQYVNSVDTSDEDQDTINRLFYYPDGHERAWRLKDEVLSAFPTHVIVEFPDTIVAVCGFLP